MPKLKRSPVEEKIFICGKLIENRANMKELDNAAMARATGRSVRTMQKRRHNPGDYTLRDLVLLSKRMGGLGIDL